MEQRIIGWGIVACLGVGSGCIVTNNDEFTLGDSDWKNSEDLDFVPDEVWAEQDQDPLPGASKCTKGVRPAEAFEVDAQHDSAAGTLRVQQEGKWFGLPLQGVSYSTKVVGTVAETTVEQIFANPFDEAIEAVYVFPLPEHAAVDDYEIRIGERSIKGQIKRRDEARKLYEAARSEGRRTALLEQERPNIFTQSVANIPPGEAITVVMHMVGPVTTEDNRFELALPTVVGPRFIPGTPTGTSGGGFSRDTDRVPDASKITPKPIPQGYVSCAELKIHIELDGGVPLTAVSSRTHHIDVGAGSGTQIVDLSYDDELLNRDFVLRWRAQGKVPQSSMMVQQHEGEGYFTLVIYPPPPGDAKPVPRELIFVVDTSGSMSGTPLEVAKTAMHKFVEGMRPQDAFQVIRFSSNASKLGPKPMPASPRNQRIAHRAIQQLRGGGGTHMLAGIEAALGTGRTHQNLSDLKHLERQVAEGSRK